MQNWMNDGSGSMGGYGVWSAVGVLLIVFLVVAGVKLLNKK